MDEVFKGFEPANTTPVPDVLFDELLPTLKEAELKALLYIIRRTLGFKKSTDAISLTQFKKGITTKDGKVLDKGCGVKDRTTLIKALASLEEKGCIESIKAKTASGDDDITSYRIRFRNVVGNSDHHTLIGSGKFLPPNKQKVVGNSDHGSGQNRRPVVGNSDPQETVVQETVVQEDTTTVSDDTQQLFDSLSQEEIEMILALRNKQTTEEPAPPTMPKKPRQSKNTKTQPLQQPELPRIDEPDLSHLSELEQTIYGKLRAQDQKIYLAWSQRKRAVYNNYLGTMGYAFIVNITPAIIRSVDQFEDVQPSIEDFKNIAKRVKEIEKPLPREKRYYTNRGMKLWDYAAEWPAWKNSLEMDNDPSAPTSIDKYRATGTVGVPTEEDYYKPLW